MKKIFVKIIEIIKNTAFILETDERKIDKYKYSLFSFNAANNNKNPEKIKTKSFIRVGKEKKYLIMYGFKQKKQNRKYFIVLSKFNKLEILENIKILKNMNKKEKSLNMVNSSILKKEEKNPTVYGIKNLCAL